MFVPCPHCGFLVALIVSKDGAAQHCPRCRQRLDEDADDADDAVVATTGDAGQSRPVHDPAGEPLPDSALPPAASGPTTRPAATSDAAAPAAPASTPSRASRRRHRAPSFVRTVAPARPATGPSWPGRLAVAGLAAVLAAQLLLVQRHELAASEHWRPVLADACAVAGCELPPWREPTAYTMLARSVQPAGRPGVLSVTASFRNDARWPQPWPALSLSLSDVRGQTVAQRTFAPGEYRADDAAASSRIAPGQSASVQFEVIEPASPIVAFTFEFQ